MHELTTLHENGLFLRREALAFGYEDRELYRGIRRGELARIRRGAYVAGSTWDKADGEDRHRLRSQAALLTHDNRVALSHTSGCVAWGLRLLEPDLRRVHVMRLDEISGRLATDVAYHEGGWTADDVYTFGEGLVMSPELCALGAASLVGVEAGLCVLDSVLDLDLATPESLTSAYERLRHWPNTSRLAVTIRLVRVGAQSVGESRTRYLFFRQHVPMPVLQYRVCDMWGRLIGIADFAWPEHGLLGEFDGRIKYGRLLKPGEDVSEVVHREKLREDAMREATGFGMIRYTYGDLYVPDKTAARTLRMLHGRTA